MKKRCVCYARVSTDSKEQETSIESQVAFFKQYVNSNPELELVDTFIDHGISATDVKNRTEFLEMLKQVGVEYKSHKHFEVNNITNKPFDVILIKDVSRFSRNLRQCLEIIECLKNNGVAVYFISENIFSDRASDLMMLQLLGTFSENFSRSLSEKIRLGHEMATKNSDRSRKYYVCNGKKKYGVSYCNNKNISLLKLDSLLTSKYIVSCLESIKLLNKTRLNKRIQALIASKDKCIEEEVEALKHTLNTLSDKLNKLLDLYLDGELSKDIYSRRKSSLDEEINSLKASIEAKSKGNDELDLEIQELRRAISDVNTLEVKEHYTDEEIILMINKITVEDNYLYIKLNINGSIIDIPEPLEFS